MTGRLSSPMQHSFRHVPVPRLQRSSFDRTHGYKTTFDPDYLIPYYVDEVLPGDTISLQSTIFARVMTMVFPVMDNLHMDTHFFYCPSRLLWDNWERFNGAQDDPADSIDYEVPVVGATEAGATEILPGSLGDYFGLPTGFEIPDEDRPSALPFRAYNFIWNQWFRDENMQNSVPFNTGDGPDILVNDYAVLKRGKRFDYFTSCLTDPQKGPDVLIPLGDSAPVVGTGQTAGWVNNASWASNSAYRLGLTTVNGTAPVEWRPTAYGDPIGTTGQSGTATGSASVGLTPDPDNSGMIADLSAAVGINVNDLREAIAFQQVFERDMRGGTRYVEHILAHWGVEVPDFRLQRPEYLGGSSQLINVSTVPQTTASPGTPTINDVQGGLAAYASVTDRININKTFLEHGYIIGLVSVRADLTYQQGMRRMWSRRTRFDFALPDLMHLGEQPVYMKEIYMGNNTANNNAVFGYQERYGDYRYFPSLVTGAMRSNHAQSLDAWHLALEFGGAPALDNNFIQSSTPISRVVAVPSQPTILFDSIQKIRHARCMPVYAIPGLRRL